ncbi:MAG: amidophosphoribosyltransferase [Acidimicrobiales bacterium]
MPLPLVGSSTKPGRPVAHLVFDGLYALQHRGQESAGMAVSDGDTLTVVRDMGLVTNVFDERILSGLPGHLAIGHTRYSTTGSSTWHNAQPVYRSAGRVELALGHNGNLINTSALASRAGMLPGVVTTDSDLMAELLAQTLVTQTEEAQTLEAQTLEARTQRGDLERALTKVLPSWEGAFSLVCMDSTHLIGVRDPNGFRPLCLGRLGEGWVLASETPALDVVGASFVRELDPGEMVVIETAESGRPCEPRSVRPFPTARIDPHFCIFEMVYFARPDAQLCGIEVHGARRRMGEALAEVAPVDADLVMGVPESGVPAAEGYARRSGIPYGQGLVKNRYIGRTFIVPDQEARAAGVRRKLNPLRENIAGKRLVVVDDSVVRGTTQRETARMLREAGATEIHLRVSSPPFTWPCYFGIDTPSRAELLAANHSLEEMRAYLGVDSMAYLSIEDLEKAIGVPGTSFCSACLTGDYPLAVPDA